MTSPLTPFLHMFTTHSLTTLTHSHSLKLTHHTHTQADNEPPHDYNYIDEDVMLAQTTGQPVQEEREGGEGGEGGRRGGDEGGRGRGREGGKKGGGEG